VIAWLGVAEGGAGKVFELNQKVALIISPTSLI